MKTVAALFAAALLLSACGGSADEVAPEQPAATSAAPPTTPAAAPTEATPDSGPVVDIVIEGGKATPQGDRVEVKAGQEVTLKITSDADEEIHVHSEPEHTYEVAAGETLTESFTLTTPGQVAVEAHHLDVTVVQLVVRP